MSYGILGNINRVHIVGIGGAGMSAIAKILHHYHFIVTGSDLAESETTHLLDQIGIKVYIGHKKENIRGAELIAYSSAVRIYENVEITEAVAQKKIIVKRDELLGELMRHKTGICVAGTHGKTTTTTMIGVLLAEANYDPTVLIGGYSDYFKGSAVVGQSKFMVIESDEYDRSFLKQTPTISVITSIEAEHLDIYSGIEDIRQTFQAFAEKTPFYGKVIGCIDEPEVQRLFETVNVPKLSYGITETDGCKPTIQAKNIQYSELKSTFEVYHHEIFLGKFKLNAVGDHNVKNALAAICVGIEIGIPAPILINALKKFVPVRRRFQVRYNNKSVVIDDYGHHPSEVKATLTAARDAFPQKNIIAILQPHLFSRTKDLYKNFAEALVVANRSYVCDIYPAREKAEEFKGVTSLLIVDEIQRNSTQPVQKISKDIINKTLHEYLKNKTDVADDVFVFMGAGDITLFASEFAQELKTHHEIVIK